MSIVIVELSVLIFLVIPLFFFLGVAAGSPQADLQAVGEENDPSL